jgi:phosphopantothenoylcysteine decarboxylase/phosphopantothenate--cysteine ligase
MWAHPATQRNIAQLEQTPGFGLVGPVLGEVASGDHGLGRMAEPQHIVETAIARLSPQDLAGRHIVVTAGPTVEDVDPVRFLGNRSTGKMGFAIAERAGARGARVTLITGPVALETPHGVERVDVRGALSMRDAIWQAMGSDLRAADALIMSAAVGDFRPPEMASKKLKRTQESMQLELVQNPDILAGIGRARGHAMPALVGFAVEADDHERVLAYARGKLASKRVDLVVANHARDSFGKDDNIATFVSADADEAMPRLPKGELAERILDWVLRHWQKSA